MINKDRPTKIKVLELLNVASLFVAFVIIGITHIVPPPLLEALRMPLYLRAVGIMLGIGWPLSLNIYHLVLSLVGLVIILNIISLRFFYSLYLRRITKISSVLGLFLLLFSGLFFSFSLTLWNKISLSNIETSIVYAAISFVMFVLDLKTLRAIRR